MRDGYHPIIIGQRAHVEVRGLTEDLDDFDVVIDESDVLALGAHPRIGIAAQTTQPIDKVHHLVALDPGSASRVGRPIHRHGLPADQTAPGRGSRPGAPL